MMENEELLLQDLKAKINDGQELIKTLKIFQEKVHGVDKLTRKISQEIKFLIKVSLVYNCYCAYVAS